MRTASQLSKRALLLGAIAVAAFVANAAGVLSGGEETPGTLSVKLTKKFTISFATETDGVAWSRDGSTLGVSSDHGMRLSTYDASGHRLTEFQSNGNKGVYLNSFAFINGASQVLFPVEFAAPIEAALDIRDVATGKKVKAIARRRDNNFSPNATSVLSVSPDQKRFVLGTGILQGCVVYSNDDGDTWRELSTIGRNQFGATSFTFFPDNRLLAVGQGEGHFMVVDSSTGETIKAFKAYNVPGIDDNVGAIAVSPKGDMLLVGLAGIAISGDAPPESIAWDQSDHAVASIWRISDAKQIAGFPDKNRNIRQAVWDPKGRFVAFVDTDSLVVWEPEKGQNHIRISPGGLTVSLAVSSDGKALAYAYANKVTVYSIENN